MMRNFVAALSLLLLISCGENSVDKPERLIDEDKMIDIFYDLSLLDAMRSQKPLLLTANKIHPNKYIYTKYKIDSLQFAQSNRYYASDIKGYKKMYEKVHARLKERMENVDGTKKPTGKVKSEPTKTLPNKRVYGGEPK